MKSIKKDKTITEFADRCRECGTKTGKLIKDYKHILFMIGETCVDESKRHITSEEAIEKIRSILTTSKSLSQNNQDLGRTQERME